MTNKGLVLSLLTGSLLLTGCASEPVGTSAEQVADQLDNDFDGVINERDKCPDTLLGATINNEGCPALVSNAKKNDLIVLFEHDSSLIDAVQKVEINRAVQKMLQNPQLMIVLEGHASASGASDYNERLSKSRASAVRKSLIAQGVESNRINIKPLGESKLLLKDETLQAESLNRRVTAQFKLMDEATDLKWHIYSMEPPRSGV
ncbi:OmpA family protein [Photobacterium japonica]|uniref:OmpA family protein n=1 Tax=Photobacterium japonica TaxID=2910235 RepID=UPI003D0CF211